MPERLKEYHTVRAMARDEFVERRSRFIGWIAPATTEEEAVAFINSVREENRTANHNVYAYLLREGQIQRYSDDAEPQGTAGLPVLEVLSREGLTDVVAVVTRYFGGVLLGAGGLVRAYSHAAKLAVDAAEILYMSPSTVYELELDYSLYGRLTHLLPRFYAVVLESDFGVTVRMRLVMKDKFTAAFEEQLREMSNDTVALRRVEHRYENIREDGE